MIGAVVARVLSAIPVLFGISVISFFLIRLVPGDVVDVMMGQDFGDPKVNAELRRVFGVDKPLVAQFTDWFGGLLRLDLGNSFRTGRPVTTEMFDRFPVTLELAVASLTIALLIAIPFGILSATRRNSPTDMAGRVIALLGMSLPNFWLGILLIMVFAVTLGVLPSGGYVSPADGIGENLRYLILPALTLGTALAAILMRMTRSSLLEVLGQDFVRTARAKGLAEPAVISRHALRNALVPVVTVLGIQAGRLLGGTVIVETVFSWPGLGSLVVRAIGQRDYPLVQGLTMFLAFFFVLMNLVVDIVYVYLDPRLRRG